MLSTRTIDRLVTAGQWETLLEALMANGRPLPLALRSRLLDGLSAKVAALGLALQRLTELTYAPTPEVFEAAARLCDDLHLLVMRGTSGCGSHAEHPYPHTHAHTSTPAPADGPISVAAAAMAAAGLADMIAQAHDCARDLPAPFAARVQSALRACAWLISDGLDHAQPAEHAAIVWQLGRRDPLRAQLAGLVDIPTIEREIRRRAWWKRADCAALLALAGHAPERKPQTPVGTLWHRTRAA